VILIYYFALGVGFGIDIGAGEILKSTKLDKKCNNKFF
jgi:hypothetical protein